MERITLKLAENSDIGRMGDVIELSLTPTDVRIQEEMSTYLAGYKEFAHRADELSPVVLVDKDTDKFRNFSLENTFEPVKVKGSIEGVVPEVDPRTQLSEYKVVDRFVGSFINDITAGNAGGQNYQPRQAAMRRCQRVIQMDREIDVATLLRTNSNWGADFRTALGAGFQWNGGALSDPIYDLQTRLEASAQGVTSIALNRKVANVLLRHPSVRDYIKQHIGDAAADQTLANVNTAKQGTAVEFFLPGMPKFIVTEAKYIDPSDKKLKYIHGDSVVLLSNPDGMTADGETICTTKTFRRRGGAGVGYETREFRIENRGPKGGTMVVVTMADVAVMTANNCGGLIENVIQ